MNENLSNPEMDFGKMNSREMNSREMNSKWIISQRGAKNEIDFSRPYDCMVEKERRPSGRVEDTAIVFLSNRECSFKCLMCDLWKNTSDESTPVAAIPEQIEWALSRMPSARHIKLYNSGSFFDEKAIPRSDYARIAQLVKDFETVIVESHPRLIGEKCLEFRDLISGKLEVAIGLETAHPEILARLNKQMTLDDFKKGVAFLKRNGMNSRAFILLRPPFMTEQEGVLWAQRSMDFAFDCGVDSCTVIPVRAGNGAMEELMQRGEFGMPRLASLEEVLEYGIAQGRGLVFADTWDLELFSDCKTCFTHRYERIHQMNLSQVVGPEIICRPCINEIGS
jgi:radical SAM enzyme (TIGR01210 family)